MNVRMYLHEMFDPALKCDRVGHKLEEHHRSGYYYDSGFRTVVTNVIQARMECTRCGYVTEWKTTRMQGLQSFSVPIDIAEKIRAHSEDDPFWMESWGNK